MYLTYSDYLDFGGELPSIDFTRQEFAARKKIDSFTFNRLQGIDPVPESLKMCTLELIKRKLCGDLDGEDYTSQGSGKLSGQKEDRKNRAYEIIREYLQDLTVNGIPIFYAGNI